MGFVELCGIFAKTLAFRRMNVGVGLFLPSSTGRSHPGSPGHSAASSLNKQWRDNAGHSRHGPQFSTVAVDVGTNPCTVQCLVVLRDSAWYSKVLRFGGHKAVGFLL